MARLVTSGFEFQTIDTGAAGRAEGQGYINLGSPTIDTSVPRSGAACLKCTTAVHYARWASIGANLDRWIYVRAYLRVDGNSTTSTTVLGLLNSSSANVGHIFLVQQGSGTPPKLRLRNSASTAVGSDGPTLAINTWYRVEIGAFVPTSGNGKLYFWLDDTLIASSDAASTTNLPILNVNIGTVSATPGNGVSVFVDDVAINDTAGATPTGVDQDGRPGEGRIVLRKPTSGVASGFTGGAGGAAAATAIDNTPPVGVAAGSATDSSQIKSGISNTTDNYEATLDAYTASEITSNDLVTLIQPTATIGWDPTSGVHGLLTVTANPAEGTEVDPGVSATAAGTYPTGWVTNRGLTIYSPSVTLGSSPKVKIRRGTNNTTVLHVAQLGLYVEYQRRLTLAVNDTTSAADALGKAPGQAQADTATLTDSLAKAPGHAQADTVALSDALAKTSGHTEADTATATDATTKAAGKGLADSATLSDATSKAVGHAITDSASLTDALTTADTVVLGDSVTVTDQITPDLLEQFTQSVGDSVTVSDAVVLMASSASGTQPTPGGAVMVPVIRRVTVESHRLHFNDPVFLTDDLSTDRRLSDLQRAEELALLA